MCYDSQVTVHKNWSQYPIKIQIIIIKIIMKTREDFATSLKYKFYVLSCKFDQFKQIGQYTQMPMPADKDPQIHLGQQYIDNLGISDVIKTSSLQNNQASYDNSFQNTNIFKMFVNRSKQLHKTRNANQVLNSKLKQLQIYQITEQKPQIQHSQKNSQTKLINSNKEGAKNQSIQIKKIQEFINNTEMLNKQIQMAQYESKTAMKQQINIERIQERKESDTLKQEENQIIKLQPSDKEQQGVNHQSQHSSQINYSFISVQQEAGYIKKSNQLSQQQVSQATSGQSQQKLKGITKVDVKQDEDKIQDQKLKAQSSKSEVKAQEEQMNKNLPTQKVNNQDQQIKEIRKLQLGQQTSNNNQQQSILNQNYHENQDMDQVQQVQTNKFGGDTKTQSEQVQNSFKEQCEVKIEAKQQLEIANNSQIHLSQTNQRMVQMDPAKQIQQEQLQYESKQSVNLEQSSEESVKQHQEQLSISKDLCIQELKKSQSPNHNSLHENLINKKESIDSKSQKQKMRSSSLNLDFNHEDHRENSSRGSSLAQHKNKQFKYPTANTENKNNNHRTSKKYKGKKLYIQKAQKNIQRSQQNQTKFQGTQQKIQRVKRVKSNIIQKFLNQYNKRFNKDWLNNSQYSKISNIKATLQHHQSNQLLNGDKEEVKNVPQSDKDSIVREQNKTQQQSKSDQKFNESKILEQKIQQVGINKIEQKIDSLIHNNYNLEAQFKVSLTRISQLFEKVDKIQKINMKLQEQNKLIRQQANRSSEQSIRVLKQKIQYLESTTKGLNQQIYKIGNNIFKELYQDQHQVPRKNSR